MTEHFRVALEKYTFKIEFEKAFGYFSVAFAKHVENENEEALDSDLCIILRYEN